MGTATAPGSRFRAGMEDFAMQNHSRAWTHIMATSQDAILIHSAIGQAIPSFQEVDDVKHSVLGSREKHALQIRCANKKQGFASQIILRAVDALPSMEI